MKRLLARTAILAVLTAAWPATMALGGPYMSEYYNSFQQGPEGCSSGARRGLSVPGVMGPHGEPVPMVFPYSAAPPSGEEAARAMLAQTVPCGFEAAIPGGNPGMGMPGMPGMGMPGMPGMGMPGMPGMGMPGMPGMGMPGPYPGPSGVVQAGGPFNPGAGVVQVSGGLPNNGIIRTGAVAPAPSPFPVQRTEVRFAGPAGMKIAWYTTQADGKQGFGATSIDAPGRYNFLQAAIYRLKLSDIPGKPGVELYPTLEVVPANSRTSTFLAHSAVPVNFSDDDFDQVAAGSLVTKVIYLPDPQFQDLASTGLAEVVSSQLEPGVDPIVERSAAAASCWWCAWAISTSRRPTLPRWTLLAPTAERWAPCRRASS